MVATLPSYVNWIANVPGRSSIAPHIFATQELQCMPSICTWISARSSPMVVSTFVESKKVNYTDDNQHNLLSYFCRLYLIVFYLAQQEQKSEIPVLDQMLFHWETSLYLELYGLVFFSLAQSESNTTIHRCWMMIITGRKCDLHHYVQYHSFQRRFVWCLEHLFYHWDDERQSQRSFWSTNTHKKFPTMFRPKKVCQA